MKGCYVDTVKCAIITGAASQGIGFAEARRFLEAGWNVVSIDKDEAKFSARMGELPVELRERMEYVRGDVSCEADCRRLVEAVCRKRGRCARRRPRRRALPRLRMVLRPRRPMWWSCRSRVLTGRRRAPRLLGTRPCEIACKAAGNLGAF